ncbi:hypothetical protein [Vulgatibacter sp.]|uniref:hypothetical protein n=1 Tax=Vulgatibacter sp. TaxID=1971226 RepID=UPI00356B125A
MNGHHADAPVLLFTLGGRRFAAPAVDVRRVARRGDAPFAGGTALGAPRDGSRGLVVRCGDGEAALAIDEVHGMLTGARLHRLPALVAHLLPRGGIAGLVEHEDELLPLLDLPVLLRDRAEDRG